MVLRVERKRRHVYSYPFGASERQYVTIILVITIRKVQNEVHKIGDARRRISACFRGRPRIDGDAQRFPPIEFSPGGVSAASSAYWSLSQLFQRFFSLVWKYSAIVQTRLRAHILQTRFH